jgi:heat-inducible transcriptional repressor
MLTQRQESILRKVVEGYLRGGHPVGSKAIAADPALDCSPSTVRNELALLEERGLLAHPHTSAGRVPTDAGHRYVVDRMLAAPSPAPAHAPRVELSLIRREVEEAMRVTTQTLSEVTNLLAVVSAPSPKTATIRHVEVLELQPEVLAVVIITSTGGVTKTLIPFDHAVDAGLVSWAGEYLDERVAGLELGARMVHQRLADPSLSASEQAFIDRLSGVFDEAAEERDTIYIDGTAHLFAAGRLADVGQVQALMNLLERRVAVLEMLHEVLVEPDVYVRIGGENEIPAMRSWALVGTGYGMPQRKLGAVSVIGPVHMDYARAIATVRGVAGQLSRFVEDAYAEG